MAPHSSTLAWKIPWTEEPGRQQSMGSQRVGHDCATSLIQLLQKSKPSTRSTVMKNTFGSYTVNPCGLGGRHIRVTSIFLLNLPCAPSKLQRITEAQNNLCLLWRGPGASGRGRHGLGLRGSSSEQQRLEWGVGVGQEHRPDSRVQAEAGLGWTHSPVMIPT